MAPVHTELNHSSAFFVPALALDHEEWRFLHLFNFLRVTKAAIISLTQHIAVQYGLQGVRCNAITPGVILSEAMEVDAALVEFIKPHILTPAFGKPGDIAALAAFLASDESAYIAGQAIACDGGHLAHQPQMADVRRALPG